MTSTLKKSPARTLAVNVEVDANNESSAWMLATIKVQRGCWQQRRINSEADEESPGVSLAINANVDDEKSGREADR